MSNLAFEKYSVSTTLVDKPFLETWVRPWASGHTCKNK